MRTYKSLFAVMLALAALSMVRCGTNQAGADAGTKKDGSAPPPTDSGTPAGDDGGTNPTDGGITPPTETTIVDMNKKALAKGKVHFKGVAMSQIWRVSPSTPKSTTTSCMFGMYMADPTAVGADHNGVLLVSKNTGVTADPNNAGKYLCNQDSPLQTLNAATAIAVGDELEVTGYYSEYCFGSGGVCDDQEASGTGISIAEISANYAGDVTLTGNKPGVPSYLPVSVTLDDIYSKVTSASGAKPVISTLGANWWKYRSVLVKLSNVKVTDITGASCNMTIADNGTATTNTLVVSDDVDYQPGSCPLRPTATGKVYDTLVGFPYFTFSSTQLQPRGATDATPSLP